jgi:hypothetical protein
MAPTWVRLGRVCGEKGVFMADQDDKHPIVAGLVALVAVTAAVGVIVGAAAVVGTRVLHLGSDNNTASTGSGASLVVPFPTAADLTSGAASPSAGQSGGQGAGQASGSPSNSPSKTGKPTPDITLTAAPQSVSSMESFTISGQYSDGEGHIVRLQRRTPGGSWQDFGVPDMDVQGGKFSTSVQTGVAGKQQFRVKDVDTKTLSNVVTVTVG